MASDVLQRVLSQVHVAYPEHAAARIAAAISSPLWSPHPQNAAQIAAVLSPARILLYGGMAGGGKSSLLCGVASTMHRHALICRRQAVDLDGLRDEMDRLVGRDRRSGQPPCYEIEGRSIQLGSMKEPEDWAKYQGKARDFLGFDEAPHFTRDQITSLIAWNRSTDPDQRCRVILAGNPPMDADGYWLIEMFAPWLDDTHPHPAAPGEVRYYGHRGGREVEFPGADPEWIDGERVVPMSRSFIPARVDDNPYLRDTGYIDTLDALPDALRSMLRYGRFSTAQDDHPQQIIPSAWVRAAQERWSPQPPGGMDTMGVDVARGGQANTVVACRHGTWFAPLVVVPGTQTPDGPSAAAICLMHQRDGATISVDVIGAGGSCYDHLVQAGVDVIPINVSVPSREVAKNGVLKLANLRAQLLWRMREALDPASKPPISLPPDPALAAELTSVRWNLTSRGILAESKDDIIHRLHRSTDRADAVVMALPQQIRRSILSPAPTEVVMDYELL